MKIVIPDAGTGVDIALEEMPRPLERGLGRRGGKYDNRVRLHHLAVQTLTDDDTPAVAPCDLRHQDTTYSVVTAYLGLVPDSRCRFTHIRVEFQLGEGTPPPLRPRACTMYPSQEKHEFKRITSIETTVGLGIKANEVEFTPPSIKSTKADEMTVRQYHVITSGHCGSVALWDIRGTVPEPELAGDFVFVLVTATPRQVPAAGYLRIMAEVEAPGFRIPLISPDPKVAPIETRFHLTHGTS